MRRISALVVAAGLVLAGCGGDDSDGESGGGSEEKPPVELSGEVNDHGLGKAEGGEIALEVDDFYFSPTYVEAQPGETVKVELESEGSATHTFTVDSLGIDETIDAGAKVEVEVTMPDSGSVSFYCRFHRSGGMQGAFYVGS